MRGIQKVSTKDMSREDWLVERRKTIGGSDASGIMGLSKWASPYSVWAEKTGRVPEKEDTEAMRQGRDLEEYVALRWCEETGTGTSISLVQEKVIHSFAENHISIPYPVQEVKVYRGDASQEEESGRAKQTP